MIVEGEKMTKVKRFKTKPVEIKAIQWTGQNFGDVKEFAGEKVFIGKQPENFEGSPLIDVLHCRTLEGTMWATVTDYIIQGLEGEFYPCKESIFNKKYEES